MILKAVELQNFRQFYGTQRIELGTGSERNVTVVYGANGAGKTSLLNAFTWALYKTFSPAFEQPDHLINEHAWEEAGAGEEVAVSVTLEFEHQRRNYTVTRTTSERKDADGAGVRLRDAAVSVSFIDEYGESHNRDDTHAGTINEVLPERLHRFFFFDGERIEQLVKAEAYEEIEKAIKGILGLQVVENAIAHTDQARRDLEREVGRLGTEEDRELTEALDDVREKRSKLEGEVEQYHRNVASLDDERQDVDDRYSQLEATAEKQRERDELERDLAEVEKSIAFSRKSLGDAVARDGWRAFTEPLARRTIEVYGERREKGEIPRDVKLTFVEDLLEKGRCICGRDLAEGSEPHACVAAWRERAGDEDVEAAWQQLPVTARHALTRREELFRYVKETLSEQQRYRDQKTRVVDKLSAISEQLRRVDDEEITGLEERRRSISRERDELQRKIGGARTEIERLNERERDLERQLEKARAENAEAELARRRTSVARSSTEIFRDILRLRTEEVREQLDARIKSLYGQISFKTYVPLLDSDFRLDLRTAEGESAGPVAKSTGENQILSLSFVGAIAEHARDRFEESGGEAGDGLLSFQGGIYPIVMDSPFGSLDTNYQQRVADAIPKLAPQVLVFASKSQGMGAVQEQMAPRISREYVIVFHTPKQDVEEEAIVLRSGTYPYITYTDGFERADLIEVGE